jgi:putative endopeptidase
MHSTLRRAVIAVGLAATTLTSPAWAAEPAASMAAASHFGSWGFDLSGRDLSVAPGADFYQYANGADVKALVIPPDRSRYGAFDALSERSTEQVRSVLESAAANPAATGEEAMIGAFYRAFMDERRVEVLDAKPLAGDLAAIEAVKDRTALASLMGKANSSYFASVFGAGIGNDFKSPDRYAIYLGQEGLGLPDRDYYLKPDFAAQKAKYQAYVAHSLEAVRWPDPQSAAKAIVDFETAIAEASWSRVEQRDPVKSYNPMTVAELQALAPGFPWAPYLAAADLGSPAKIVVAEKTAFPKIAALYAATPLGTLKAWEAFNVVDNASPYLSKRFVDASFDFHSRTLSGQPEQKPRWKRAAAALDGDVGEAVGKVYVARYFPPESKAKMEALIGDLRTALAARIQRVDWMSPATKARALQKLSMLTVKVGYPSKWRDYSALTITADDLYGDVERASAFDWARQVKRLDGPVDRGEWGMTPQTVNAYYNPLQNEIVFPAAILQPPFFDPTADPAVNYGGVGAVIGHEMTHGFDDQGRQFDGTGALADWWAPEDAGKFVARTRRLGAQYSAFEPLPGAHVNGDLTMGENIADLGGVLIALDAYHVSLKGRPAPAVDGLTGDQRFFLGAAQVWRAAAREDDERRRLVSDPHSPPRFRANGTVRNVEAWYAAFDVKPGDAMYLPPDQRVQIW